MKMTKKYDDLNDAFDVNNDIVQPEVVEKRLIRSRLSLMTSKRIMTIQEAISTQSLKRDKKHLMVCLNLLKNQSNQEHMKLQVS